MSLWSGILARQAFSSSSDVSYLAIILILFAVAAGTFAKDVRESSFRKRGARVDSGRGLPDNRSELTGTPLSLCRPGITLKGILLDDEHGAWALEHLPTSPQIQKVRDGFKSKYSMYLRARFGDTSLADEVRRMSCSQLAHEGDITLSAVDEWDANGKKTFVELRVWGPSNTLAVGGSRVLVGRLDYESILKIKYMRDGELTIRYDG